MYLGMFFFGVSACMNANNFVFFACENSDTMKINRVVVEMNAYLAVGETKSCSGNNDIDVTYYCPIHAVIYLNCAADF